MALTKVSRGLLSTSIVDNGNATAITIDSSENVGLGAGSPAAKAHIYDASTDAVLYLDSANVNGSHARFLASGSVKHFVGSGGGFGLGDVDDFAIRSFDNLIFATNNSSTERMRIDSSGNALVGRTSSLSSQLGSVSANTVVSAHGGLQSHATSAGILEHYNDETLLRSYGANAGSGKLVFKVGGGGGSADSEAMRIDSSGNLLVGQTTASSGTVGASLRSDGRNFYCADGNYSGHFNRKSSDGAIVHFAKDDTIVGSIFSGHGGTQVGIGTNTTGITFNPATRSMMPANPSSTNPQLDATLDIGFPSVRWKDLYLSSGVYLGGTGAANKLDDYESGTWTPTVTSSGGTITTVTSQIGTYTKIGRTVILQYQFNIATLGTASGNIVVKNHPFAQDNSEISYYAGVHRARSGTSSITEFHPSAGGTLQLYGTTPVAGVYFGSMVYNTTA